MATPIGHSLAGYAVAGFSAKVPALSRRHATVLCILMALAPDLDLLPGLLRGQPALYHGGLTHSFAAGLVAAGVVASLHKLWGKPFLPVFALGFVAYTTHLLLDYLGPDNRYPYGMPLFWPMTNATYLSPVPLLLGVQHARVTNATITEFARGILNAYNLASIVVEVLWVVPFVLLARLVVKRERSGSA